MTAGIVDLVFTSDKRMVVLDDAGTLWIQSDIGLEHASKPIGARPRYGWKKISPMPPVRVTRLIGGSHQNLVVLCAGGRAYEQMPDTDNVANPFLHQRHYWVSINPPEEPVAPVAKAAPTDAPQQRRTEIAGSWTRNVAGSWEFDLKPGPYLLAATVDVKLERLGTDGEFKQVTPGPEGAFQLGETSTFRASNEASGVIAVYRVLGE